LINIFKDRQDPEIKQIDEYPVWLLELALPLLTFEQAYPAMATNDPALVDYQIVERNLISITHDI
jgi:hypothetical protein